MDLGRCREQFQQGVDASLCRDLCGPVVDDLGSAGRGQSPDRRNRKTLRGSTARIPRALRHLAGSSLFNGLLTANGLRTAGSRRTGVD